MELMEAYKEGNQAKIAKAQVDKLIDLAAPPPKVCFRFLCGVRYDLFKQKILL